MRTSDAGKVWDYSYLKIRGLTRNASTLMINGVPAQRPEDHQVYWVDMPDLLASTQDIQVQRGWHCARWPVRSGGAR